MNPYRIMQFHEKEFNKTDRKIYQAILDDPQKAIRLSIVRAAEEIGTSKDALLRFCKKIGFEGFKEFRFELARYIHAGEQEQAITNQSQKRDQIIQIYCKGLQDMLPLLHDTDLQEIIELILSADRIRIFGVHRTGLIAQEFAYRLMKIGIASDPYTDAMFFKSIADLAKPDELHIYVSMSGTSIDIVECAETSKRIGAKTMLITQNDRLLHTDQYDKVVLLPMLHVDHREFFLDTTLLCYPFIEIIIMSLSTAMINYPQTNKS